MRAADLSDQTEPTASADAPPGGGPDRGLDRAGDSDGAGAPEGTAARRRRYAFVFVLYVSQYLGIGFLFYGASAILRTMGASLDALSAITALGLLWALKFLWAPAVDRWGRGCRGGQYRSWLLGLQPAMAAVLVAISWVSDLSTQFALFLGLTATYVTLAGTQDIAVDALAVRLTPPAERGLVNGLQVCGSFVGNLLGGGLTAVLYELVGWRLALLLLAGLTVLPVLAVVRFREPTAPVVPADAARAHPAGAPAAGSGLRHWWALGQQPGAGTWMFLAVPLAWGGLTAGYSLITPSLADAGWGAGEIGLLLTGLGSVVGAVVAMGTGVLLTRWGRVPVLIGGGLLTAAALALFLPVGAGWAPRGYVVVAAALFMGAYTVGSTVVYLIKMDYARPGSPGSDYTTLSSFAMIAAFGAGAVSLSAAQRVGYPVVMLVSLAVYLAGTAATVYHQVRHRTEGLNVGSPA